MTEGAKVENKPAGSRSVPNSHSEDALTNPPGALPALVPCRWPAPPGPGPAQGLTLLSWGDSSLRPPGFRVLWVPRRFPEAPQH